MMAICIPSGMGHDHGGRRKQQQQYEMFGGIEGRWRIMEPKYQNLAVAMRRNADDTISGFIPSETPNFCSECGAKLGAKVVFEDKTKAGGPTVIYCHPHNLEAARAILREKPKPEPVGNFQAGDNVHHTSTQKRLYRIVDDEWCFPLKVHLRAPELGKGYDLYEVDTQYLRHVHKCDDGRTCNCKTCNPCGKADDLDCTCEKCCPRTLDGLVDLFGADVVRGRATDMACFATAWTQQWIQRMDCAGVSIQWSAKDRFDSPVTLLGFDEYEKIKTTDRSWRSDPSAYYRINPSFFQSQAWQKLSETPCVFDGKNWTPKTKGSES